MTAQPPSTSSCPAAPGFTAHDTEVQALETAQAAWPGPEGLVARSHWAWHLRERDTPRATALATATLAELNGATPQLGESATEALRLRLNLTLAECARLNGQLDRAAALLDAMAPALQQDTHLETRADALWVRAMLQGQQGQLAPCSGSLVEAIDNANAAKDTTRAWLLEAALARHTGMTDRAAAHARWGQVLAKGTDPLPPAAAAAVGLYTGYVAFRASDFGGAIQHFTRQLEPLREHGLLREATIAAVNTSGAFVQLNDTEGALVWIEQALAWAQASGWPGTHGGCLSQLGELLHRRGDLIGAQRVLAEAQAVFQAHPKSRNYVVIAKSLAEVNIDLKQPRLALAAFERLIDQQPYPDLALSARLGKARALLQLEDKAAAQACAAEVVALARAQGASALQIDALQVLADVARSLGRSADALHHLQSARALAQSTPGYKAHADLLSALASAHARGGAFEAAYSAAEEAATARAAMHRAESANRHQAMQIHALLAAAKTEAEHLRELAAAERQKAALQTQAADTLARLGLIGQELTRHLDRPSVYASLAEHIPALLDASGFEIYLVSTDGQGLDSVYGLENGERLPPDFIWLSDPVSNSARCAREQCEVLVALAADGTDPTQVPGTMRTLSALFAPLMVGARLLGVMTVQSPHANAYGAHESQVFRSLCAYAAIALDNASAYQGLHDARSQLVAQEKLAALGALVAGVAHELNTPLGNSLLMASTLEQNAQAQVQALQANAVRRSDLAQFLKDTTSAADLITQSLGTAARLINNFKQVAVDRSAEQRRRFDLAQVSGQVVATMQVSVRQQGHTFTTDLPEGIDMDSLPGPYGQVLTNLINNAMLHGFGGRAGGHMHLSGRRLGEDRVELRFSDDGSGIDPIHAKRIFDPFFTTKFGQGGSGLGLSISFNIVSSLLGGQISLDSTVPRGACFILNLPLRAPAQSGGTAPEHFA